QDDAVGEQANGVAQGVDVDAVARHLLAIDVQTYFRGRDRNVAGDIDEGPPGGHQRLEPGRGRRQEGAVVGRYLDLHRARLPRAGLLLLDLDTDARHIVCGLADHRDDA